MATQSFEDLPVEILHSIVSTILDPMCEKCLVNALPQGTPLLLPCVLSLRQRQASCPTVENRGQAREMSPIYRTHELDRHIRCTGKQRRQTLRACLTRIHIRRVFEEAAQ